MAGSQTPTAAPVKNRIGPTPQASPMSSQPLNTAPAHPLPPDEKGRARAVGRASRVARLLENPDYDLWHLRVPAAKQLRDKLANLQFSIDDQGRVSGSVLRAYQLGDLPLVNARIAYPTGDGKMRMARPFTRVVGAMFRSSAELKEPPPAPVVKPPKVTTKLAPRFPTGDYTPPCGKKVLEAKAQLGAKRLASLPTFERVIDATVSPDSIKKSVSKHKDESMELVSPPNQLLVEPSVTHQKVKSPSVKDKTSFEQTGKIAIANESPKLNESPLQSQQKSDTVPPSPPNLDSGAVAVLVSEPNPPSPPPPPSVTQPGEPIDDSFIPNDPYSPEDMEFLESLPTDMNNTQSISDYNEYQEDAGVSQLESNENTIEPTEGATLQSKEVEQEAEKSEALKDSVSKPSEETPVVTEKKKKKKKRRSQMNEEEKEKEENLEVTQNTSSKRKKKKKSRLGKVENGEEEETVAEGSSSKKKKKKKRAEEDKKEDIPVENASGSSKKKKKKKTRAETKDEPEIETTDGSSKKKKKKKVKDEPEVEMANGESSTRKRKKKKDRAISNEGEGDGATVDSERKKKKKRRRSEAVTESEPSMKKKKSETSSPATA